MTREIFRCAFGSRLFGTATPDSDEDFRSVVLPTRDEVILGSADFIRQTESRERANTAGDVDRTDLSAQAFLRLLEKSEVTAIETLFAPALVAAPERGIIHERRHDLVSADVRRFIGFSKSQTLRYGGRGKDVAAAREVLAILIPGRRPAAEQPEVMSALRALAEQNPEVRIVHHPEQPKVPVLSVSGRSAQLTQPSTDARAVFQAIIDRAGARTLAAADAPSKGDLKGMYHALRILMEAREILETGELRFPLAGAPLLRRVRAGEFSIDRCIGMCDEAAAEVSEAEARTQLPKSVNQALVRDLTIEIHEAVLGLAPQPLQEPERTTP